MCAAKDVSASRFEVNFKVAAQKGIVQDEIAVQTAWHCKRMRRDFSEFKSNAQKKKQQNIR